MDSQKQTMADMPFVSIVIPARNASKFLERCLNSIKLVDYPFQCLEVIVADNGSTDDTADIATKCGARVVDAFGLRVGGVRNRGAQYAKGSILAFTDSDILVGKSWISSAIKILSDCKIGAVGGGCHAPENGTWVEKAWTTRSVSVGRNVMYLAGSSLIISSELFNKLGAFNDTLIAAEDDDLSQRIRDVPLLLFHEPNCDVIHLGYPQRLIDVARRQVWLGRSIKLKFSTDPMTLLTYIYLIALLMIFPSIMIINKTCIVLIIIIIIIAAIPLIVAIKKAIRGSEYYSVLSHLTKLWIIYVYYYCGKSMGIIKTNFTLNKNKG